MFIFPMAGNSQRFRSAGFKEPKFMLQAHGRSLFTHAVLSFSKYFETTPFLFIARKDHSVIDFVNSEVERLKIRSYEIIELENPTAGQADTVFQGLSRMAKSWTGPIAIFNIDTFRRNFELPSYAIRTAKNYGGYLEVFRGEGTNWSFVRANSDGTKALEVREKKPISNLCSTGFYHFASAETFLETMEYAQTPGSESEARERYVAPLYNALISRGRDVHVNVIQHSEVYFCGIPLEYASFLDSGWTDELHTT